MVITEVRVKLCEENNERLLAFCSVTLDNAFVIRDLKVIEGTRGMFVAMPSRKLTDRCGRCGCKNHLRARFCNQCGSRMDEGRAMRDADGRAKLHADIAHPIHSKAREQMSTVVVRAFQEEKERAKLPGYVCRYDEYDAGDYDDVPMSYAGMVAESTRPGIKAHGPHSHEPKETHMVPDAVREPFGVGVM
ncbi:MAG TPA: SpoVG family protein [Fimbriiglobus sp.]